MLNAHNTRSRPLLPANLTQKLLIDVSSDAFYKIVNMYIFKNGKILDFSPNTLHSVFPLIFQRCEQAMESI